MITPQHTADLDFDARRAEATDSEAALLRWLGRLFGSRGKRTRQHVAAPMPIYRVTRITEDRWVVERPGASMEHAFANLEEAVAFVRHECLFTLATVELRIDDLLVVAQLDPNHPNSLFGEAVS
jgi:hypothetical protein